MQLRELRIYDEWILRRPFLFHIFVWQNPDTYPQVKAAARHMQKCIDHIYEDLNADLSVKGLAAFTKLNVSYLSKLFKQETGQTVKAYVTAAKMDTAQNLLKS